MRKLTFNALLFGSLVLLSGCDNNNASDSNFNADNKQEEFPLIRNLSPIYPTSQSPVKLEWRKATKW